MPYADNDGQPIYYEVEGKGPPVLMVMGLGSGLVMWSRLRPVLTPNYRVVMFDNRGVGRTGVPDSSFTMKDLAADTAAVLDAAGIDRAHVFGVSMGGMIAQEFALTFPDRVLSLVLACTTHGGPDAQRADDEVLGVLTGRRGMTPDEGVRAMIPFIYDPTTPRELIEKDLEMRVQHYPPRDGYVLQLQAIATHDCGDRLHQINVPTLVIHGESDRLIPPENGVSIARRIEDARLVLLDNASHIMFVDQPEQSVGAILDFLAEVTSGAEATKPH